MLREYATSAFQKIDRRLGGHEHLGAPVDAIVLFEAQFFVEVAAPPIEGDDGECADAHLERNMRKVTDRRHGYERPDALLLQRSLHGKVLKLNAGKVPRLAKERAAASGLQGAIIFER